MTLPTGIMKDGNLYYQITSQYVSPIQFGKVKLIGNTDSVSTYSGVIIVPEYIEQAGKKYIINSIGPSSPSETGYAGHPFKDNTSITDIQFANTASEFITIDSTEFEGMTYTNFSQLLIGDTKIQQGAIYNNSKFQFNSPANAKLISMVYANTKFIDCQFYFNCKSPYNSQIIFQQQTALPFVRCIFFYQSVSMPPQSEYLIQDINADGSTITLNNGQTTSVTAINNYPEYTYYLDDDFSCNVPYTGAIMKLQGRLIDQCSVEALSNFTKNVGSRPVIKFMYDDGVQDTKQSINLTTQHLHSNQFNIYLSGLNKVQFKITGFSILEAFILNVVGDLTELLIGDLTASVDYTWQITAPDIFIDKLSVDYTRFQNLVGSISSIQTVTKQLKLTPLVLQDVIMFKTINDYAPDMILQTDGAVRAVYYSGGWQ